MGDTTVSAPGAQGEGETTTGQAPATGSQPPADNQGGNTPAPGAQGEGKPPAKTDLDTLPQDVRDLIEGLRDENRKHRQAKQTSAQAAEEARQQRAAILKALKLAEDGSDEELTEDELNQRIAEANDATWAMGVQNVLLRVNGIDADELLDSRAFLNSLDDKGFSDRDPREKDFAADLGEHVAEYVKKHPRFKAAPPTPGRSGGDHPGGAGAPNTRPSLHAAIEKGLKRGGGR